MMVPLVFGVLLCSWLIWLASEWIGRGAEIIGHGWNSGVRGATISAVSSSLPELFVALMFLNILGDESGFLGGLATMTGSAIFNILLIPGAMGIVALLGKKAKKSEVSRRVVLRDGMWLLSIQILLLGIISLGSFGLKESLLLLAVYGCYVYSLFRSNRKEVAPFQSHRQSIGKQLWRLVAVGITLLGVSCYFLVEGCVRISELADWSLAATALIVAAAATSLPDTFISIRDAMGNAPVEGVSNAFGSNIFDLCVALGLPVMVYTLTHGEILLSEELQSSLTQLWLCMMALTVFAVGTLAMGKRLTWAGSAALLTGYIGFVASVLMGVWSHVG